MPQMIVKNLVEFLPSDLGTAVIIRHELYFERNALVAVLCNNYYVQQREILDLINLTCYRLLFSQSCQDPP